MADKPSRAAFDPPGRIGPAVARVAQDEGVIVRAMGDTIAFSPPLIITPGEIDTLFGRFRRALPSTRSPPAFKAAP